MGSGWLHARNVTKPNEAGPNSGSDVDGGSSLKKFGSGLLKAVTGIPTHSEGRTGATPKERLFRRQKTCGKCGLMGHIQADCTSITDTTKLESAPISEPVLIYRRKGPQAKLFGTILKGMGGESRGEGAPSTSSHSPSGTSPNPSVSSQTSHFSPPQFNGIPYNGFPDSVPLGMPAVELPDEGIGESWSHLRKNKKLPEELGGTSEESHKDDSTASSTNPGTSSTAIIASTGGGTAQSDWSDFEKYGIDIDLFVGSKTPKLGPAANSSSYWDAFTRYGPGTDSSDRIPQYTSSGILEPKLWPEEESWGSRERRKERGKKEEERPKTFETKSPLPTEVNQSPLRTGWVSNRGLTGRSQSAPSAKLKAMVGQQSSQNQPQTSQESQNLVETGGNMGKISENTSRSGQAIEEKEKRGRGRFSRFIMRSSQVGESGSGELTSKRPPIHQKKGSGEISIFSKK